MLIKKTYLAILVSSLVLLGCSNNENDTEENTSQIPESPLTTEYESSLTLQKDAEAPIEIKSRTSTQDDNINAYSLTHEFNKGSTSIIFSFNFDKNDINQTLHIVFNPTLNKVQSTTIGLNPVKNEALIGSQNLACSESLIYDNCKGISLNFNDKKGEIEITFKDSQLSSPKLSQVNETTKSSKITLNGKLTGRLSVTPQDFTSIRKTSQFDISVNQIPISFMGALYDPESKSIFFNTYTENGMNAGLKLDEFTTYIENNIIQDSILATETLYGISGACQSSVLTTPVQDKKTIGSTESLNDITLTFNEALYQYTNNAPPLPNHPLWENCHSTNLQLNGSVKVAKPLTKFTVTTGDKNNAITPYIQPALYFDVINHNQQAFGNEIIQISLKDSKIEKINFKEIKIGTDNTTGLLTRFENNFSCDKSQSCKGVSYDAANTKVTFSNTALVYKDEKNPASTQTIYINGIFDFAGR